MSLIYNWLSYDELIIFISANGLKDRLDFQPKRADSHEKGQH